MRRVRAEGHSDTPYHSLKRHGSPPPPEPIVDWALALSATPRCCVCGEAYVQPASAGDLTSGKGDSRHDTGSPSSLAVIRRGTDSDESFVVLPDSKPILSESYFSLSRNISTSLGVEDDGVAPGPTHTAHEMSFVTTGSRVERQSSRPMSGSVDGLMIPISRMHESGYASILGGWTGSGFGTASSMLSSIVQISHAGLSDNVRRESILRDLSKRPAQPLPAPLVSKCDHQYPTVCTEEVGDPTLCSHCYASLLERIDEDCSLAERDGVAYRDFIEALDRITEDFDSVASASIVRTSTGSPTDLALTLETESMKSPDLTPENDPTEGIRGGLREPNLESTTTSLTDKTSQQCDASLVEKELGAVANSHVDTPTPGEDHEDGATSENGNVGMTTETASRKKTRENTCGEVYDENSTSEGTIFDQGRKDVVPSSSPLRQALRVAEQTSAQLRAELNSLETRRAALCARGSETWAGLANLAYARGVLGGDCRQLLRSSREVAETAWNLSERSALSDMFAFRHMDGYPSINGHRLGRVPDERKQLHWNEINAAWGQAVLLVRCVSNAVDFHSRRFRLVPLNCSSRVVELASAHASGTGPGRKDCPDNNPVVFAHDLFSSGGRGDDKLRLPAAINAFLSCSTEVIAYVEQRLPEQRLGDGGRRGVNAVGAPSRGFLEGVPYQQSEDGVGGTLITSLKSQSAWKAWLCQLVKNLEWLIGAGSSLCVS